MNELSDYMNKLLDHNDVLHNHADVLEEHDVRLSALEKVINAPAPEVGDVKVAETKVDEPGAGEKETSETKVESTPKEKPDTED